MQLNNLSSQGNFETDLRRDGRSYGISAYSAVHFRI